MVLLVPIGALNTPCKLTRHLRRQSESVLTRSAGSLHAGTANQRLPQGYCRKTQGRPKRPAELRCPLLLVRGGFGSLGYVTKFVEIIQQDAEESLRRNGYRGRNLGPGYTGEGGLEWVRCCLNGFSKRASLQTPFWTCHSVQEAADAMASRNILLRLPNAKQKRKAKNWRVHHCLRMLRLSSHSCWACCRSQIITHEISLGACQSAVLAAV
jgi:hypothetical protein